MIPGTSSMPFIPFDAIPIYEFVVDFFTSSASICAVFHFYQSPERCSARWRLGGPAIRSRLPPSLRIDGCADKGGDIWERRFNLWCKEQDRDSMRGSGFIGKVLMELPPLRE